MHIGHPSGLADSACPALVRAANREQSFLATAAKRLASNDEGNLEALGDALEDSGGRIGAVGVHDPELRRIQGDYKDMFGRAASGARKLVSGLRSKDEAGVRAAKQGLGTLGADESRIAHELGAYCRR